MSRNLQLALFLLFTACKAELDEANTKATLHTQQHVAETTLAHGLNLSLDPLTLELHPKYFGIQNPAQIQISGNHDECGETIASYNKTDGWRTCAPEKLGIDSVKLRTAIVNAAKAINRTESVVVIRRGYIAGEGYFGCDDATGTVNCTNKDTPHHSWSMAKGVTATLVGLAISDGKIASVDQQAGNWVPQWKVPTCMPTCDNRQNITLRHLMTLTSGLKWAEDWNSNLGLLNLPGNLDVDLMDGLQLSPNPVAYVTSKPLRPKSGNQSYQPGEYPFYSTGDPAVLSQVIQSATGQTAFHYAQSRLFNSIGMKADWKSDFVGRTRTYARLYATPRDFAKFGQLYLDMGKWNGTQLIPQDWIEQELTPCGGKWNPRLSLGAQACYPSYGYLWHVEFPLRFATAQPPSLKNAAFSRESIKTLPHDAFMAEGIFGQTITVIPSLDLVIVRTGDDPRQLDIQEQPTVNLIMDVIAALDDSSDSGGGPYQIKEQDGGKCLSVFNNPPVNGSFVKSVACGSTPNQNWYFAPTFSRGYFTIKEVKSGKCLDNSGSMAVGDPLVIADCQALSSKQAWRIVKLGGGLTKLINKANALVVESSSLGAEDAAIQQGDFSEIARQLFSFTASTPTSKETMVSQRDFTSLKSMNQRYQLVLTPDGNLVEYDQGSVIWTSMRAGQGTSVARVQNDGNFVIYRADGTLTWQTNTAGSGLIPFRLTVQDDGNIVLRDSLDTVIWKRY